MEYFDVLKGCMHNEIRRSAASEPGRLGHWQGTTSERAEEAGLRMLAVQNSGRGDNTLEGVGGRAGRWGASGISSEGRTTDHRQFDPRPKKM